MVKRDVGIAYLLLIFGGPLGLHKFYLNQVGWGIAYLLTGGFFFVGVIIDFFTLSGQVDRCNWEIWARWPWIPMPVAYGPPPMPGPMPMSPPPMRQPVYAASPDYQRQAALQEADRRLQDFTRRLNNLETVIHAKRY